MRLRIVFIFLIASLSACLQLTAQVTSANIEGFVSDESGKPLEGAIVRAIHGPSGTVYGSSVRKDGSFYVQNLRVGGPYQVSISYAGTEVKSYGNIYLRLGETYQLIASKINTTQQLAEVSIVSAKDNIFNNQHNGATTVITSEQIATLPSLSRSAYDFIGLTPQSNKDGYGTNIGGRNSLYNNVQINGANFNNAFGLSSGFSGGGMPIPLDAVQEIQVALSDFDVRQSDFTGANINMVTRSGTNDFTGSVYTYYRDQSFNGTHIGPDNLPPAIKSVNNIFGARLGGPIIKNKFFFFVNGEYEKNVHPGISPSWVANTNGATGPNISRANADSLQKVSDFVKKQYGYNTGAYQGYANNFTNTYTRFIARLDYNINDKNKLDASYTYYSDAIPNTVNSASASGGSVSNARNGAKSLAFANTDYSTVDKVNAYSIELVSTVSHNISNQVLATYNQTRDTRSSPSSMFPFVDILDASSGSPTDNYTSLGYELFTYKNDIQQNTLTLYDNLTIRAGINNITAGISYQSLSFANSYLPYGTTYYRFASINDFLTNQAPTGFGYSYPYQGQDGSSKVHYGLPGAYIQDKISLLHNKLTLTGGVRVDMPLYLNTIPKNSYIDTLNLLNPNAAYNNGYGTAYHTTHYNASQWPKETPVVSPRFSFNWSPFDDRKLQIRGGSGVFLGQVPFVWFTNAPANSGAVSNNVQVTNSAVLQYLKFQPTAAQALAELPENIRDQYFPQQSGNALPGQIAAVAPNFKMPEVWRSDLAADYKLPWLGLIATAELIYTKDIYSVYQFNANQPNPTGNLADSNDHRPTYPGSRIYSTISGAYILANSKLGDSYSATIGVARAPQKGFYCSLYYTHSYSEEVSSNPGSQPGSAWEGLDHLNSPNEQVLAPSAYYTPDRIVATASYRLEYAKHFASTLSLYYSGSAGSRFDWTYYDDINGDGIYGQLIYIPKDANEMKWKPIADRSTGKILFTAQQQATAFNAFISQDKYLSKHKGEYAQRNGDAYPFYSTLNLRFLQDVFTDIGKRRGSLQFSLDVMNLPNLLNRSWGLEKMLVVPYGSILSGSTVKGVTTYQMETVINNQGQTVLPTSSFINNVSTYSVWSMQLGLRFTF